MMSSVDAEGRLVGDGPGAGGQGRMDGPTKARGTDGELVYAIGDVHGRYDLVKQLLMLIGEDARARAEGRKPVVIFCGDYIDRGPQSNEVLQALLWLQAREDLDVRLLRGNHEDALLRFLERPQSGKGWAVNGGDETLVSYGLAAPSPDASARDWADARDRLLARMPSSHLRLLQRLEWMVVVGDYVFVHAGIRPGRPLKRQVEGDLLWIRGEFLCSDGPFEKVVVHGHSWIDAEPRILGHRIGLDTGAYETGVLTAVRLDGEAVHVLRTAG